jgi:hypothetical protein
VLSHEPGEIRASRLEVVDVTRHDRGETVLLQAGSQHLDGILVAVDDRDDVLMYSIGHSRASCCNRFTPQRSERFWTETPRRLDLIDRRTDPH